MPLAHPTLLHGSEAKNVCSTLGQDLVRPVDPVFITHTGVCPNYLIESTATPRQQFQWLLCSYDGFDFGALYRTRLECCSPVLFADINGSAINQLLR